MNVMNNWNDGFNQFDKRKYWARHWCIATSVLSVDGPYYELRVAHTRDFLCICFLSVVLSDQDQVLQRKEMMRRREDRLFWFCEENGKHEIGTVNKSKIWFSSLKLESFSRHCCSQVSELVQCGESRDKVKCVLSNGTDDNVLGREWEILTKIQNNTGTVIQ